MGTYVTKKCPHCGHTLQFMRREEPRKYGCPCKICTNCKKPYLDTDIKEPALYGYINLYEISTKVLGSIACLIFCVGAIAFLVMGIFALISGELLGLLSILIAGIFISGVVNFVKKIIYHVKHKKEILSSAQIEFDESMIRLKDTDYLTALAENDLRAKKLLFERKHGYTEHYAKRPK